MINKLGETDCKQTIPSVTTLPRRDWHCIVSIHNVANLRTDMNYIDCFLSIAAALLLLVSIRNRISFGQKITHRALLTRRIQLLDERHL